MTLIRRAWYGNESETTGGERKKGGRPRGSKNKKVAEARAKIPPKDQSVDDIEPATKHSVSGVLIPMPSVNTFNDVPSVALVESFVETYWDEKAWRPVLGKLTAVRYIELWDANLLVFQRDKRGKVLNSNPDWPWAKLKEAKRQLKG